LPNLIGIPYEEMDCWAIVREFHRLYKGVEISRYIYNDPCDHDEIKVIVSNEKPNYLKVVNPKLGDIILIRVFGAAAHLGIYLNENQFLHTQKGTGSIVDKIEKWKPRIMGYYRHD